MKKKHLKWSYKIIFSIIGLLFIKVFEFAFLNRVIHWFWKIPLDSMGEFIGIIVTILILLPFIIIVLNQRIRLEGAEEKYRKLAYYDPLTGLSNRRYFEEKVSHSLMQDSKEGKIGAVIFIDIDGFKLVNDTYGHEIGDSLLKEIGKRLLASVRKEDLISRFAGDEFIFYLPNVDKASVLIIVKRIIEDINKPFVINNNTILTSTSVGISFFSEKRKDIKSLLRNADKAMYKAKLHGKNTYEIFNEDNEY
ncbi:GGDEF domain-containing protein [Neobacillus sp. DY30]|uniref:GGDEF domain-containing protein n=1 Tax=Neobacillus sp. DY30 TaxID=3047871 RepID=UPI0024BFC067|nr:GGDEF domain-containing protein [Neobacillus sp. DY30]WHY03586.1 GGDEF domain-containing protein [Neobacillus sp. DY30]